VDPKQNRFIAEYKTFLPAYLFPYLVPPSPYLSTSKIQSFTSEREIWSIISLDKNKT
jgi:hypothetical protein